MSPNHKLFVDSLDKLVTDRGDALLMEAVKALYNACFGGFIDGVDIRFQRAAAYGQP